MMESRVFVPANERDLNRQHPSVERATRIAEIGDVTLRGVSAETQQQVALALSVYPASERPSLDKPVPDSRAFVLTPKDGVPSNDLGIFLQIGVGGTGPSNADIISDLFSQATETNGCAPKIAVGFNSSVSADAASGRFPADPIERGAHVAGRIIEMLKQQPDVKRLLTIGHSLGSAELAIAMPIVEEYIRQHNIDISIDGMILTEPGGIVSQGYVDFIKRGVASGPKDDEIMHAYPSYVDIMKVQSSLDKAGDEIDVGEVLRRRKQIEAMRRQYQEPRGLTEEQTQELKSLDDAIEQAWYARGKGYTNDMPAHTRGDLPKLLKQRHDLLYPVVDLAIRATEGRSPEELNPFGVPMVRALWERGIVKPIPDFVREKVTVPVAILTGETDKLFPTEVMKKGMSEWEWQQREALKGQNPAATHEEKDKAAQFFPNSPRVAWVEVANWAHNSHSVDSEKFAEICINIDQRMVAVAMVEDGQQQKEELHF